MTMSEREQRDLDVARRASTGPHRDLETALSDVDARRRSRVWKFDSSGGVVITGGATTIERDGVTHYIFAPEESGIQILTRCGQSGGGHLGVGLVDCPGCLEP